MVPSAFPQCTAKIFRSIFLIATLLMAINLDQGGSVMAQPPAAGNWDVRIMPASSTVMPGVVTLAAAATSTVGALLDTIARQHGLARDRIRLIFRGRILREEEVLNALPQFQSGFTLILQLMAVAIPTVAAVYAGAATARGGPPAGLVMNLMSVAASAQGGLNRILRAIATATGIRNAIFGMVTRAQYQVLHDRAYAGIRHLRVAPPRKGRNPPFPSRAAMIYIRTCAIILTAGEESICPTRSAGQGFANLDANTIMAIMGYYHLKGHRELNRNFLQAVYNAL